jgi:D-alanine-D-alanine ligase-like ATP-grasp enzyme
VQVQFSKQLQKGMNFELFGYDFMLDHDFNLWLIEVNTNPCLELSSPLLKMLLPRMIEDMLQLTVDRVFPKPADYSSC